METLRRNDIELKFIERDKALLEKWGLCVVKKTYGNSKLPATIPGTVMTTKYNPMMKRKWEIGSNLLCVTVM
jgi:hypothetical protein